MPLQTITFNGKIYPALQQEGNAALWAREFANRVLTGNGVDIGCNRAEWCFPHADAIDPVLNQYDAYEFPQQQLDYIHSSHCLEHLPDYVAALDYWNSRLKVGGVLFLYLPDMSVQEYWRPWNNRKHVHYMEPKIMKEYFEGRQNMWNNVVVTGFDLNYSFYAVAEKK